MPVDLRDRGDLRARLHARGDQPEYRFLYRHAQRRLPIWRDGQFQVVRWGNSRGSGAKLPRTGWTWAATLESGGWAGTDVVPVEIPATYGLEQRGVWFLIEVGIRGILVPDEHGIAVCYMLCEPASHYYKIMTGSSRMPVLIGQRI
jgi:hypothetical protein